RKAHDTSFQEVHKHIARHVIGPLKMKSHADISFHARIALVTKSPPRHFHPFKLTVIITRKSLYYLLISPSLEDGHLGPCADEEEGSMFMPRIPEKMGDRSAHPKIIFGKVVELLFLRGRVNESDERI
ncbi:galactose oxidase/kelch repeat superfamily protein, partial [Striga asiatica]